MDRPLVMIETSLGITAAAHFTPLLDFVDLDGAALLAQDPFALWPQLGLENDAGHAFYMGVELARAQIAWQLGKRYVQDQPLDWGAAVDGSAQDLLAQCAPGTTRTHRAPQKSEDD